MQASYITDTPLGASFPSTLHVRTKIIICVVCSLSAIILSGVQPLLILVASSTVYAISTEKIRGLLIAYAFITLMLGTSVLFVLIAAFFFPEVGEIESNKLILPFFRMILISNVVLVLALTSRIQSILTSLKDLRLPAILYIPAAVMLRFIPTFIHDINQIRQSLKIRGYTITPLTFFTHPVRTTRLLIAPLVFRALRSADDLAIAAELKGINTSKKITIWRHTPMKKRDYCVLICFLTLMILAFWLQAKQGFSMSGH